MSMYLGFCTFVLDHRKGASWMGIGE